MSLYYVVKVFQDDPRTNPDHLGPRHDGPRRDDDAPLPLGVTGVAAAKRFLWETEALAALRQFMAEHGGRHVRGQVFYVEEKPVGPVVGVGEAPLASPEPVSEPVVVEAPQVTSNPFLEQGEALLAAAEACDMSDDSDHDDYHEAALWFIENAREFLDVVRERDELVRKCERLNWLRMHPESCRAAKDCRNPRKEGWIHCEKCLEDGNAGGYFDVYQRYYDTKHTLILDELLEPLRKNLEELRGRLVSTQPATSGLPAPE